VRAGGRGEVVDGARPIGQPVGEAEPGGDEERLRCLVARCQPQEGGGGGLAVERWIVAVRCGHHWLLRPDAAGARRLAPALALARHERGVLRT
jgi:hypothetical protein